MKKADEIIDKALNIFFSKNRTKLYLLIFLILGLVLRLVNVINMPTSVDASGHAAMAINFISSGKLGTWNQSVGLWYFLTDFFYKIFGVGDFGARFIQLIFGSLSIILIYLFTKEMFNERIGLIAAFLLAVSPFHIVETVPEMDVAAMFFTLFGMLLFIKALKQNKKLNFIFAGLLIGVGVLIKVYSLLFVPLLVLYSVYYGKKYKPDKKILTKKVILFALAVFIFCLVPIVSNYLLYKDKGFVDHIFTDTLGLWNEKSKQYYGWISPYTHEYKAFFLGHSEKLPEMKLPTFVYTYDLMLVSWDGAAGSDAIVLLLGMLGIILLIFGKENKDYLVLFLCSFFTLGLYLGSITGLMGKHYLFSLITLIPFAALSLDKISRKIKWKYALPCLLVFIFIFQLYWLSIYTSGHFYEKSSLNELLSYKTKNIPENSLVVVDSRIFRGFIGFLFDGRHYIESNLLSELIKSQDSMPGNPVSTDVYFIECSSGDCGWGKIQEDDVVGYFKNNSKLAASYADSMLGTGAPLAFSLNVHKTSAMLKPGVLQTADLTHLIYMYPIGYDERITPVFDNYEIHSFIDKMLDKLAHFILYFSIFIAVMSVFLLIYLFIIENETKN